MKQIITILLGTFLTLTATTAFAQGSVTMTLEPHCTELDRTACPMYSVVDTEHVTTGQLAAGDIIDIDIVVESETPENIETVRAWLSYDSAVLEARSVELTSAVVAPTPGEQNVDPIMRLVKIGGAVNGTLKGKKTAIARVTFRVITATKDTVIAFHDFQATGLGHTAVNGKLTGLRAGENGRLDLPCIDKIIGCRGTTDALLAAEPSKLSVMLAKQETQDQSSLSTVDTANAQELPDTSQSGNTGGTGGLNSVIGDDRGNSEMEKTNTQASDSASQGSSFGLLQVQNLRVTSRDRDIFLGWQALKSSALKGYNVYYGTISGQYIQRKSVPASATSIVLRDLEPGTTYYLALRAFNTEDLESAFSQEVSVVVGKPETSTALLIDPTTYADDATVDGNPIGKYDGTSITGETGVSSIVALFLLISAVIGTILASHRQFLLRHS